jgi:hypothetical protein
MAIKAGWTGLCSRRSRDPAIRYRRHDLIAWIEANTVSFSANRNDNAKLVRAV